MGGFEEENVESSGVVFELESDAGRAGDGPVVATVELIDLNVQRIDGEMDALRSERAELTHLRYLVAGETGLVNDRVQNGQVYGS